MASMVKRLVKCADCGYLGMRHYQTRELVDPEEHTRKTGANPPPPGPGATTVYIGLPVCCVMANDLGAETGGDPAQKHLRDVFQKKRACDRFAKRLPGFTPKEHVQMAQQQRLMDWQRERDGADREWRRQVDLDDKKWREEESKRATSRFRWNLAVMGFAAIIVYVVTQLFSAWIAANKLGEFRADRAMLRTDTDGHALPHSLSLVRV